MNKVDLIERSRLRNDIPPFRPGDQVRVHVRVREGNRERIQVFEGVVIARRGGGLRESFTVRKVSFGVGVERTFPVHAPVVEKVEIARHGRVRRAKLYYLRELSGRHAKIAERRTRIPTFVPGGADGSPEAPDQPDAEKAPEVPPVTDETPVAQEPAATADTEPAAADGDAAEQETAAQSE